MTLNGNTVDDIEGQIRLLTELRSNYVRIVLVLEVLSYSGFRRVISRDKNITVMSAAPRCAVLWFSRALSVTSGPPPGTR